MKVMFKKLIFAALGAQQSFIWLLLASLLPLLFTITWLQLTTQLPMSDATDYLSAAFASYRHLTDHGIWHGLTHFQLIRGWRPIYFSVLSVPFLLISKGNAVFAYQAVASLSMVATAVYVYLLLRLRLTNWSAMVATNIVCLLPFVQMPALHFFAECILFPCVLGCLYHAMQSNYLQSKFHTWGFAGCLALALLVRPVDAVMHLILPLSYFLFVGFRKRIFNLPQLSMLLAISLTSVFLVMAFAVAHFVDHTPFQPIDGGANDLIFSKALYHLFIASLIALCFAAILAVYALTNSTTNLWRSPLVRMIAVVSAIVLFWYLPYAFATVLWVYRTSIGDLAAIYAGSHAKQPALQVLWFFIQQEGVMITVGVAATALLGFLLSRQEQKQWFAEPVLYLLLLTPIPIWEVISTVQSAARKLSIAFPVLMMVLLMLALSQGRWWKVRFTAIVTLLGLQIAMLIPVLFHMGTPWERLTVYAGDYPPVVSITPNPHEVVLAFLSTAAQQYHLHRIEIEANVERSLPVDVFLLHLLEQLNRKSFTLHYPYTTQYSLQRMQQIGEHADAIFLTGKRSEMQLNEQAAVSYANQLVNEPNPILKTMYGFLYYYSKQQLNTLGLTNGPCIEFRAADQQDYLGCLLLSQKRP